MRNLVSGKECRARNLVSDRLGQFAQFGEQFAIVWQDAGFVFPEPPQHALFIDHKKPAVGAPQFVIEHAVLDRHFAMGPEIGDERIRNPTE